MLNCLRGAVFLILCLFLIVFPVYAQTAANAYLFPPSIDAFPKITAYLDLHDSQGNFIHGLKTDQVNVLENGKTLQVDRLEEICPGVQVVVAIDPGPSFGIRNNQAISRYDQLKEDLGKWANSRMGSTVDDWSLIITNGPSISHVSNPKDWLDTLGSEQINPRTAIPNLDTLFHAVNLAADQSPRQGMERTVLFITPPPEGDTDQMLKSLSAQAKEQRISINVWLVSSTGALFTQSVKQLTAVADSTGGKFFTFTGDEILPNPEEYLEPLRYIYAMDYQSEVKASGTNQLTVRIQTENEVIETGIRSFDIDLRPPLPAFVSPPIQILRQQIVDETIKEIDQIQVAEAGNIRALSEKPAIEFSPNEQAIQVVFDFPDGRKRPLVQSSLYVDGVIVAENLQPPFDQFSWTLEPYVSDGMHNLHVQVKDNLGLTGASIEIPVQIVVERPGANPLAPIQKNLPVFSALLALMAGAVLFLVLIMGRKLRPSALRISANRQQKSTPVTQPLRIKYEAPSGSISKWISRFQISRQPGAPVPVAYLSFLPDSNEPASSPPLPITLGEMTIGSAAKQVTLFVNDSSVDGLHARLKCREDGSCLLSDEGSIAGTWVNYSPVPKEGIPLEHGDLIHVGRLGFRFSLRQPTQKRKPLIVLDHPPEAPSDSKDI